MNRSKLIYYISIHMRDYPDPQNDRLTKKYPDLFSEIYKTVVSQFDTNFNRCHELAKSISEENNRPLDWMFKYSNLIPVLFEFFHNLKLIEENVKKKYDNHKRSDLLSLIATSLMVKEYEHFGSYEFNQIVLSTIRLTYQSLKRVKFMVLNVDKTQIDKFQSQLRIKASNLDIKKISQNEFIIKINGENPIDDFELSYIDNSSYFDLTATEIRIAQLPIVTKEFSLITPGLKSLEISNKLVEKITVITFYHDLNIIHHQTNEDTKIEIVKDGFSEKMREYIRQYVKLVSDS